MSFYDLESQGDSLALVSSEGSQSSRVALSYSELKQVAAFVFSDTVLETAEKTLGVVLCRNKIWPVAAYLAALRKGFVPCLLPESISGESLRGVLEVFKPDWIAAPEGAEFTGYFLEKNLGTNLPALSAEVQAWAIFLREDAPRERRIFSDLALLLSTSGSSGSPKMVRLSYENIKANSEAIVKFLEIETAERAITSLSMAYTYGLSVINSHLTAGASLLLTDEPITSRLFWQFAADEQATSFAGVPYQYQLLKQLRLENLLPESLTTMTTSGGSFSELLFRHFAEMLPARGIRWFRMYGQTEATARISYVPPERLADKGQSVGVAIPGGDLSICPESDEIIYRGPCVMLGYARSEEDLSLGDELGGVLRTGDLGYRDEEGFFFITGRKSRVAKIMGLRFNLDELEAIFTKESGAYCACLEDNGVLIVASTRGVQEESVRRTARNRLGIHHSGVRFLRIDKMPLLANGKVDYVAVLETSGRGA